MELEEGDLVVCIVDRIEKTVVFVKIPTKDKEIEGSIVTSEIAPGRIRNIRDYVIPKKRIVCKVLRISKTGNVELSFRRVSLKERKEILEKEKLGKGYVSVFKSILGENYNKVISEISKKGSIVEFIESIKEDPKKLEEYVDKKASQKILDIINTQKEKKAILKEEVILKTTSSNGLEIIKEILSKVKNVEIRYVSAGKYSLRAESKSMKESGKVIKDAEETIERLAKNHHVEFSILEK